jgi:hypothetical protein
LVSTPIAELLSGGDRRSIGAANAVAAAAVGSPRRVAELVRALTLADAVVRMRAADALEKISRSNPALVQPHASSLLRAAEGNTQAEVRWHLAQIFRKLKLGQARRLRVSRLMRGFLRSTSAIVRTEALTTLVTLAKADSRLRRQARRELARRLAQGSPAERARARQLVIGLAD